MLTSSNIALLELKLWVLIDGTMRTQMKYILITYSLLIAYIPARPQI